MRAPFLPPWLVYLLLSSGLGLAFVCQVRAGEIKFPADGSCVVLTLPEGWTTSDDDDGSLKCTSEDGEFSFDLLPGKILGDPKTDLAEAAEGLGQAAGLKNIRCEDGGEKTNANGVKITGIIVHGWKGEVEYVGVVSIFSPPTGQKCAFQCFGTKTGLVVHSKQMSRITASFKSAQ